MFKVIFGVGVVAVVLQFAGTSVIKNGRGLKFNNTENVNMEMMLGQWFVVRSDDRLHPNPCYLIEFHKDQPNKFSMHLCNTVEGGFVCVNVTDLTITDGISGEQFYRNNTRSFHYELAIPETDYDNYAVIEFQLGSHNFVVTLSRNNVILNNAGQLDKLTTNYIGNRIMRTYSSDGCPRNNASRSYVDT